MITWPEPAGGLLFWIQVLREFWWRWKTGINEMTKMSWFLAALSIIMVCFNGYYMLRGRVLYRGVIFWNFAVALQFLVVYILVIYDSSWIDIMSWQEITGYLVKPLIACFAIMLMVSTYFLWKRNDHG